MEKEVSSAVKFLTQTLRTRKAFSEDKIDAFDKNLIDRMLTCYEGHWFPECPNKGSAYRQMRISREEMDDKVRKAAEDSDIRPDDILTQFPEVRLWIDPHEVSCQIGEDGSVGTVYENVEAKEEARARAAEARLRRDAERERERRRAEDLRRQLSQGSAGEGGASSSGESSPSSSPPPPTTPPHPQHPAAQVQQQQQSPVNRAFTATPTHMQNPVTFFPAGRLSPQHHPQQLPHSLSAHVLPPPPQVSRPSYSPPHHPMALAAKQAMRQNHSYPNFRQHQQQQQQQWIQQQQQQLRQSPVQFPPATTHALMGRGTPSPPMFTAGFLPMQQQQQQQQQQGRPMENPMQTMRNTQELLKSISIQNFGRSSPSSHLMHQSLEYVCS